MRPEKMQDPGLEYEKVRAIHAHPYPYHGYSHAALRPNFFPAGYSLVKLQMICPDTGYSLASLRLNFFREVYSLSSLLLNFSRRYIHP